MQGRRKRLASSARHRGDRVVAAITAGFASAHTARSARSGATRSPSWASAPATTSPRPVPRSPRKAVGGDVNRPSGGFNDQQFLAAVASGNVPDLVYLDRQKVGTYAAKGAFLPLTSCIKSQKINMKQYRRPP